MDLKSKERDRYSLINGRMLVPKGITITPIMLLKTTKMPRTAIITVFSVVF